MTKILFLLSTVVFLSACGSNSIIESITVTSTVDQDQNQWVEIDSKINIGALRFPALTLPIANPKNPSELVGRVALSYGVDGSNRLSVQANLSRLQGGALGLDKLLPNGDAIPISGMDGVVSVKIKDSSKIYMGTNANQIMLGVDLVIPIFDSIPGSGSLFLPLPAISKIDGVGGAFLGRPGKNGLGLFILIPNTLRLKNSGPSLAMKAQFSQTAEATSTARAIPSDMTSSNSNKLKRQMYYFSQNPYVLNVK